MMLPEPFAYPLEPHKRRHGPMGYANYREYKPWLRDEFSFRCVYCLEREAWYPNRSDSFAVDHVVPQSVDAARIRDYENLVYACNRCNSLKGAIRLVDPTADGLGGHLRVDEDGSIRALTTEGRDIIDRLLLAVPPAAANRIGIIRIASLKRIHPDDPEVHQLYCETFGYPENLPDLRRCKPPLDNARRGSEEQCCLALRERGELGMFY